MGREFEPPHGHHKSLLDRQADNPFESGRGAEKIALDNWAVLCYDKIKTSKGKVIPMI